MTPAPSSALFPLFSTPFHHSNLLSSAISTPHLLLSPLPVSRIASPAGQCLCLSLMCPPSTVDLKTFLPLLCLHHHTPARLCSSPATIPPVQDDILHQEKQAAGQAKTKNQKSKTLPSRIISLPASKEKNQGLFAYQFQPVSKRKGTTSRANAYLVVGWGRKAGKSSVEEGKEAGALRRWKLIKLRLS